MKKWVKSVQTAGYNGTHTVYDFLHIKASQKVKLLSYETQTTRWQDLHGFQQDLAYTRQETLVSCLTKLENFKVSRERIEMSLVHTTDYGCTMKPFFIEIPNFWAWADTFWGIWGFLG